MYYILYMYLLPLTNSLPLVIFVIFTVKIDITARVNFYIDIE